MDDLETTTILEVQQRAFNALSLLATIEDFRRWALTTFPHSTPSSCAAHLAREVEELRQNPTDPGEIADCIFLSLDCAFRAGLDIVSILAAKLAICKERTWGPPDAEGVSEHVREEEDSNDFDSLTTR